MIVKGKDRKGSKKKQASTTPSPPESHEQMRCDRCARDFQSIVQGGVQKTNQRVRLSPDRSEENDRPHLVSWPFGGQGGEANGRLPMGREVETWHHHHTKSSTAKSSHHEKRKRRPSKTPPHGILRRHRGTESSCQPTVGHRTPRNVEAPPVCHTPPRISFPRPITRKKRWQRHTLLQTGYHSSSRHRHTLPVLKLVSSRKMKKDKTALPSPISKLPATRPALSKPPSWVLLRKLSQKRKPHYPRYHLSSTSSCREMEKLSQPRSFVSSPSLPPP